MGYTSFRDTEELLFLCKAIMYMKLTSSFLFVAVLVKHMKGEAFIKEDFGILNLSSDEVTYTYKNEIYQLYSHPYEPCLYLYRGDELVCALHNAYNPEHLVKAFSAGETVKTNYGKDYDKEYDEEVDEPEDEEEDIPFLDDNNSNIKEDDGSDESSSSGVHFSDWRNK